MRKLTAVAGVLALTSALAACSGGSEAEDTTGGLDGDAVVIGVQSLDTGAVAYPQNTYGAEAAIWYVNNKLGGINGAPLEMDLCSGDGTPETGVKCANDFVASDVPVVFDAYDGTSVGAMTPILKSAEIPIVCSCANSPAMATSALRTGSCLSASSLPATSRRIAGMLFSRIVSTRSDMAPLPFGHAGSAGSVPADVGADS